MESKLKAESQDAVGELPNLLLREGGYPHLPTTPIKQEPKSNAWNDAGTKPDHPCLCETRHSFFIRAYQFFNGDFFGYFDKEMSGAIDLKNMQSSFQNVQWREVQP